MFVREGSPEDTYSPAGPKLFIDGEETKSTEKLFVVERDDVVSSSKE